jgi:hypothetical protein
MLGMNAHALLRIQLAAMRRLLCFTLTLTTSLPAFAAEKVFVSLDYAALENSSCPDREAMRALVAAELGYDPFVDGSLDMIKLRFDNDETRIVATIARSGPRGVSSRKLEEGECAELGASVAFAVALQIDPSIALGKPDRDPPSTLLSEQKPQKAPPITPLPPRPRPSDVTQSEAASVVVGVAVAAGVVAGAGLVPGISVGPEIGVALEGDFWSVGVSALGIVPGEEQTSAANVTASIVRGNVTPCLSAHFIEELAGSFCGNVGLGALFGEASNVSRSTPTTEFHAAVGPRVALSIEPWKMFGIRAGALVDVALARVHLTIDDRGKSREVWVTPAVAALGDLAAVLRFQ